MASFTRNHDVLSLLFLFDYLGMAGLAGLMTGESNWPCLDLGDRCSAVMAILTKAARDYRGTQQNENNQCDCHDRREPYEMFDVLEQ